MGCNDIQSHDARKYGRRAMGDALTANEQDLVRVCATSLLEIVPPFAVDMARHIHEEVPELGGVGDATALEATRISCEANVREMFTMLRAGLSASAQETPTDALDYARLMRRRGVGLDALLVAYEYGLAMFQPVVVQEFERRIEDKSRLEPVLDSVRGFAFSYIARVGDRLTAEYGRPRTGWMPAPTDPIWTNDKSVKAGEQFLASQGTRSDPDRALSAAYMHAEEIVDRFCTLIEEASGNARLSERLALAKTTVRISLLDEEGLATTLLLDRDPIEVTDGNTPGEVEIGISSGDLERVFSRDFHLAMAIARGRVTATGPVRQFLRVIPIICSLGAPPLDYDDDEEPAVAMETR
jgi:hypothetical protein